MDQSVLNSALTEKHKSIGLYLEQNFHGILLMKKGSPAPIGSFRLDAKYVDIQQAADEALNWANSGIEFGG